MMEETDENFNYLKHDIPFRLVKWCTYEKLADKLDPPDSINGNNWRMLADRLGYNAEQIVVSVNLI